jgi:hypothetical protein
MGVLAGGAGLGLVVVAHHAGVLAGERNGVLADAVEGRGVIMAILAEGLWDQSGADQQESGNTHDQDDSGANEMTRVTQKLAQSPSFPRERLALIQQNRFQTALKSKIAAFAGNICRFLQQFQWSSGSE